jgi:hypothetical protein
MFLERWRPGPESQNSEKKKNKTIEDLGRLVKKKYPHYKSMSDAEAGRRMRQKFSPAYDDFEDTEALEKPGTIYDDMPGEDLEVKGH